MQKIKTISKYIMNIFAMINALLVGLSPIWGWDLTNITDSIVVITGVIGVYLVGGKIFEINEQNLDSSIVGDERENDEI